MKEVKCDKCGKAISGVMIVYDYSYYHLTCIEKKPANGLLSEFIRQSAKWEVEGAP